MYKKFLTLTILIIILITIGVFIKKDKKEIEKNILKIGDSEVELLLADTQETRKTGLGQRESLPQNMAMLFVFERLDKYGIWMENMKFPIDVLWLDQEGKVVHLYKNMSTSTYPEVFFPPVNNLYIIEANKGFIDAHNIEVGNILEFNKN